MTVYNKIMQVFWLSLAIVIVAANTYMVFTEGWNKWGMNYIFAVLALFIFLIRRIMMKRMQKHQQFLEEQSKKK
jgi:membrane protein implicated in regulation of membrane protease activity